MPIIDHVMAAYRGNLFIVNKLVAELTPEQMVEQPRPGMNHPAWILGHLTLPRFWCKDRLGLQVTVPQDWVDKFNMGSTPVADVSRYPAKAELLAALEETHRVMEAGLRGMTEEQLMAPADERIRHVFPHVGDGLVGLVTTHESFHIGQLSAWRRAMGMKSVF